MQFYHEDETQKSLLLSLSQGRIGVKTGVSPKKS